MTTSLIERELKAKAIGRVHTVINLIYEPLRTQMLEICQKENQTLKKLDFSDSLLFIKKNWDNVFTNHIKVDKKEFKKLIVRCIEIRNKASHQSITLEQCEREIEYLRRLAALISPDVELSVNSFLGQDQPVLINNDKNKKWQEIKEEGNKYIKEGRYTEAMVEYTRAIRIDPKQPVLYSNRAIAELQLKMFEEAREDAEDAIDLSSSSPIDQRVKYYRLLSEALMGLNLLEEALSISKKGLELDSRDEVLIVRKRDIESMLRNKDIDTKNFRVDPQVTQFKNGLNMEFFTNKLKEMQKLNPSSDDILKVTDPKLQKKMFELYQINSEAHQWYHGTNGKKVDLKKAFEIFKETADKGSAEGLCNVGNYYSRGHGVVEINYYKMINYYKKAAVQKPFIQIQLGDQLFPNIGVGEAEYALGNAYQNGSGVDVDLERAYHHFLRAAHLGVPVAMNNLGLALKKGEGVTKNLESARKWIKKAADQDVAGAQLNYAYMLENGEGGPIDERAALEYYNKAALHGTYGAMASANKLSKALNDKKSTEKVKKTLEYNLEEKDPETLYLMGISYYSGQSGTPTDYDLAYKYLKEAADQDHVPATEVLIELLDKKLKRLEEAFNYCLKASKKGIISAQQELIRLYAFGHGCERDENKARQMGKRLGKDKKEFETLITSGKEVCDFEKKENLSTNGMTISERAKRYLTFITSSGDEIGKKLTDELIKIKITQPKPIDQSKAPSEYINDLILKSNQGSITAARMLKGLQQSLLAIELIDQNKNEEAIRLLKESHENCDKQIYFEQDKIRLALEKCDPNNQNAMFVKALLFGNDIIGGISFLKRCIRIHPNNASFYQILSCFYGFEGSYDKSLETINTALELDNSNPRWLYLRATAMRFTCAFPKNNSKLKKKDLDKISQTIDCYKEYLDKNPPDDGKVCEAYYSLAHLYFLNEDIDNCKLYWYKAIESEKNRLSCFNPVEDEFAPKHFTKIILLSGSNQCGNCRKQKPGFKCAVCRQEVYCSKECQVAHWQRHKLTCKIQKENPIT